MENGEKKTVSRTVTDREVIMRKYHVHIKNFRNLKDVKVTLSPLTILTGENGSGKSTFFKALLFLKHNHTHEAAKKLKYVIDDDINLGGWDQIANDPKKPISIKITEETWGYDHQVEEIYDIDNCPFELNPTEEYAERLWDSYNKIGIVAGFTIDPPTSSERVKKSKLPLKSSREFIFVDNKLSCVKINTGRKKIAFDLHYFIEPYSDEMAELDNLLFPYERRKSYITIENIVSNDPRTSIIILECAKTFFEKRIILWGEDGDSRQKGRSVLIKYFNSVIIEGSQLPKNSVFRGYLPIILRSLLKEQPLSIYQAYLDNILEILDSVDNVYYCGLEEYFSLGTVRERPQSRYFLEQISPMSYYGLFGYKSQLEDYFEISDIIISQFHSDNFDQWLTIFNLGKEIRINQTEDVVKIMLETFQGNEVNLAEASSGTLQLLPILFVLTINYHRKSFFLIQQPELHLNPRLHSVLVDFFIRQLSPKSVNNTPVLRRVSSLDEAKSHLVNAYNTIDATSADNFQKGDVMEFYTVPKHIIIETHSEHLLKKLQVLVSQGKTLRLWPDGHCSGEDVKLKDAISIYYFAKDAKGNTKAIELELDDNGFFKTETPKGFFDESLDLNRQLLLGRN